MNSEDIKKLAEEVYQIATLNIWQVAVKKIEERLKEVVK